MNKPLRIVLALLSWLACLPTATSHAQQRPAFLIESLNPAFEIEADPQTGRIIAPMMFRSPTAMSCSRPRASSSINNPER